MMSGQAELESVDAVVDSLIDELSSPKPKPRSWKDFTVEKVKDFYEKNYAGKTRTEVYRADKGFYSYLRDKGWLDEVLPESTLRSWQGITQEEAQAYYDKHFSGMGRGQVQKADGSFYKMLRDNEWIDSVLPEPERNDWSGFTVEKAQEYYADRHAEKTRGEVEREDMGFYIFVQRQGWLDEVFPESKRRDWSWMDTPEKAREFYKENYDGMSRSEVGDKDSGFYTNLLKKGWVDEVLPTSSIRDWSWMDTPEKAKDFYEENYQGMSRQEVFENDSGFHSFVQRQGWLNEVFPEKITRWQGFDVERAKAHYNENFEDLSRSELRRADKGFYNLLQRKGWMAEVCPSKKGYRSMTSEESGIVGMLVEEEF